MLEVPTLKAFISPDLQKALDNHSKVFETLKGLPPIHDHDHAIHLIPRSVPPNIRPYRYPYAQKSEIERMVTEMLEVRIIPLIILLYVDDVLITSSSSSAIS